MVARFYNFLVSKVKQDFTSQGTRVTSAVQKILRESILQTCQSFLATAARRSTRRRPQYRVSR